MRTVIKLILYLPCSMMSAKQKSSPTNCLNGKLEGISIFVSHIHQDIKIDTPE